MNNTIIIQARLGSTRFPMKVVADIEGKTMLERVVDRCMLASNVSRVIVAIPRYEDNLSHYGQTLNRISSRGADVFLHVGHSENVLARYQDVCRRHKLRGNIVRITSDCPLICPSVIDEAIDSMRGKGGMKGYDYIINRPCYPDGLDVEVMKAGKLLAVPTTRVSDHDREHVTPYIVRTFNSKVMDFGKPAVSGLEYIRDCHWSVDEKQDIEFPRRVYRELGDRFEVGDLIWYWKEKQNEKGKGGK